MFTEFSIIFTWVFHDFRGIFLRCFLDLCSHFGQADPTCPSSRARLRTARRGDTWRDVGRCFAMRLEHWRRKPCGL
eukprot:s3031_g4.t1